MKIIMTIAPTLAVFASSSSVSAMAPLGGHYEWQYKPHSGALPSNG